jgi:hypothetical protein
MSVPAGMLQIFESISASFSINFAELVKLAIV